MTKEIETKAAYINLSDVKEIPHPELFAMVSQVIAEDTLQYINEQGVLVNPRQSFYVKYGKRFVDIVLSAIALIITLPINLLLAMCTFFDVGRPIIFQQKRVGRDGKLFTITKFRNMTNATDENGVLLPPAQRVTKLGRFVRKTSLDELLNFWSVFKGDMSLIGPRPLLPEYLEKYSDRHKMRHSVKPGLECPMIHQVNNRMTWKDQFENDVYYVEHVSFILDIRLAFALVRMVFNRRGTIVRGNGMRGSFMGYNKDGSSIDSCEVPLPYYYEAAKRLGYKVEKGYAAFV